MTKKRNSIRFTGDLEQLKAFTTKLCRNCLWSGAHNHFQCRFPNGAVLNWWETTGTLSVQGPGGPAAELEERLYKLIQDADPEAHGWAGDFKQGSQTGSAKTSKGDLRSLVSSKTTIKRVMD